MRRQLSPRTLERAFNKARAKVIADEIEAGIPAHEQLDATFRFASYLISSGVGIKTVQKRLRHASAKTTLDVYGYLFPDSDDSTRDAVSVAFEARPTRTLHAV